MSPATAIVLGDPGGSTTYARVQTGGESLVAGVTAGQQFYFTGTGVEAALEQGLLVDVSAAAIASRRSAMRHEFLVIHPDGTRERYGVWREAQNRAKEVGGRIEVVPAETGGGS
jgi:hypothetical protein